MGDKYRHFSTNGGKLELDLSTAMLAAIAARETELRKLTDSNEVFARLEKEGTVSIYAKALNEYRVVGKFSMAPMPGCCGVVISYHSQIEAQFRKRGLGTLFLVIREDAAKRSGYSCIMATVLDSNIVEKNMLAKVGWFRQNNFKNNRTKNVVEFWTKIISSDAGD